MPRPVPAPTSSWPTWWPRPSAAPRRRRRPWNAQPSAPNGTTRSDGTGRSMSADPRLTVAGTASARSGEVRSVPRASLLQRFQNSRHALGWSFMLPAAVLLLLFLTYPLGLGVWLGFTDTKVGRAGQWVGLENFEFLVGDSVTLLALFNTIFYTAVASVAKFGLGLWLALMLNRRLP